MNYQIMEQRLSSVLERDKMSDPQNMCEILKGELSPIISNYMELEHKIDVRFQKVGAKLLFQIDIEAERIRPFGYLPK